MLADCLAHLHLLHPTRPQADDLSVFDVREPAGTYRLNMARPYDRYVWTQLISYASHLPGVTVRSIRYARNRAPSQGRSDSPDVGNGSPSPTLAASSSSSTENLKVRVCGVHTALSHKL